MQTPDNWSLGRDAVVVQTMNKARLRFSTEIVKRLGEELNPSMDRGVLELVKNAYDADATSCRVELCNTDDGGGTVIVNDNGVGMTVDDISNGWLVLGRSTKTQQQRTPLGRIPAGSKGLGRLAALRMGRRALMTTFPAAENGKEHGLLIDWDRFDETDLVDDVELTVETVARRGGHSSGTQIQIDELRTGFERESVKRLARELILLADPFDDNPNGFRPELLASEYKDLEELVRGRYFKDAEYHLQAKVNADGQASAQVKDWKGKDIFRATHDEIAAPAHEQGYRSPPVAFDLWVFILNQETFSTRQSTVGEVRKWLSEFGGVHFYYNGLRVSPYGNPGDDWLGMNLRRVQSPEERPSTNTAIGRMDLTDRCGQLVEKTDRSGFIEDERFMEVRAFAQDAMDWMANRRLEEAEKRRSRERVAAPQRASRTKQAMQEAIARVSRETRGPIEKAFASYDSSRDKEVSLLRKEIQLYRTLSTAGIMAATFAHESSGNPIKIISQSIDAIARRASKLLKDAYATSFQAPVEGIRQAVRGLSILGTATLKLLNNEKRRVSRVDLHQTIHDILNMYQPFLTGRDVMVQKNLAAGKPYLRGSEAAIESIITNLLNNCMAAFEDGGTSERIIKLSTQVLDDRWTLKVDDSGPGIQGIRKTDIWLPGRTTRRNGTGLGLAIVRDSVKDLGGRVAAEEEGDLGGATISVELPILGS